MSLIFFYFLSLSLWANPAGTKSEDGYFKVSDESLSLLKVKVKTLIGPGPWAIEKEALVQVKFSTGVYRRYNGEWTLVLVDKVKENQNVVWVNSQDLEKGDEVAISNVAFLRLTENDLNSETVDTCSH